MIYSLEGKVVGLSEEGVVLFLGGVGLEVLVSPQHRAQLAKHQGEVLRLWVWLRVLDDGVALYGFSSSRERQLFLRLLKVNGVGSKLALALIGFFGFEELIEHLRGGAEQVLCTAPLVGKRLAGRLCHELKDALDDFEVSSGGEVIDEDAVAALVQWGYGVGDARDAARAVHDAKDTATRIAAALKVLARKGE